MSKATSEHLNRKRKSSNTNSSKAENIVSKEAEIISQKRGRRSSTQRKFSSDSNDTSSSDTILYGCKLCETSFKSKQARNTHYTGTHKIEKVKLLFLPDGTGLVESTMEHHIKLKPDYLKIAAKNMSSRICKLCKVELEMEELKWHYEHVHKVIQMSKVKPLICLNNPDPKIVAEPFKCKECSETFDDESRLKRHSLTHRVNSDVIKCKSCNKSFQRGLYNNHVRREHPELYFKKVETISTATDKNYVNSDCSRKIEKETGGTKACDMCSFETLSLVSLSKHRRCVHNVKGKLRNRTSVKNTKAQKNNITESREAENNEVESQENSTSHVRSVPIATPPIILYICKECDFATTTYDEAVSHSQDHILNMVNSQTTLCEHCNVRFGADYQTHRELHMNNRDFDIDSFQCIAFDYKHLFTDKWFDMFELHSKAKIKIFTEDHSVYFSTRCIRFKLPTSMKNVSAPFLLFQCLTCKNFVDPFSIESHVQQQSCSNVSETYPCEVCRRLFYSDGARIQHSYTHKVPDADSKYRSISFNDQSDLAINELLLKSANKSVPKKIVDIPTEKEPVQNQVEINIRNVANTENVLLPEKLVTVYKCRCGLCYHTLSHLYDHLQICSNTVKIERATCKCGLVFDLKHYQLHTKVHCFYTTILVKEIIIKPARKINIRGMVEEFRKKCISQVLTNKTTLLNKEHNTRPSNIMVNESNKCSISQEPIHNRDRIECINKSNELLVKDNHIKPKKEKSDIENVFQGKKSHMYDNHELPQKVDSVDIPQPTKLQSQKVSEKTVLPTHTHTENPQVIINDDVKRVIYLYNCLRDALKNTKITTEQTAENESSWVNAKNKEENQSLVATTIEVESKQAQNQCERIANSNTKDSMKASNLGDAELDEVIKDNQNQTSIKDIGDHNIKIESVEYDTTENEEEELLKGPDYLCPEIIDLLTDDED